MFNTNTVCNIYRDKEKKQIYVFAPPSEDFEREFTFVIPPDKRWFNPISMAWEINEDYSDIAIETCAKHFGEANIKSNMGKQSATVTTSTETPKDVILSLFKMVGPDKSEQLYKNLSRVFHPDLGGSAALMTLLNNARDDYMGKK
jgi:hypothetical protein